MDQFWQQLTQILLDFFAIILWRFFLGLFQVTKNSSGVRKYHLRKLLDLSKLWQTIFHWLNQSENRVTFFRKTKTLSMYAEEFTLNPRKTYDPDEKMYHNLKSFVIHQFMTNRHNSIIYSGFENKMPAATIHHFPFKPNNYYSFNP